MSKNVRSRGMDQKSRFIARHFCVAISKIGLGGRPPASCFSNY